MVQNRDAPEIGYVWGKFLVWNTCFPWAIQWLDAHQIYQATVLTLVDTSGQGSKLKCDWLILGRSGRLIF
jgi:hypothetical protein